MRCKIRTCAAEPARPLRPCVQIRQTAAGTRARRATATAMWVREPWGGSRACLLAALGPDEATRWKGRTCGSCIHFRSGGVKILAPPPDREVLHIVVINGAA